MLDPATYLPQLATFEGAIPFMYLDTAGKVTVGVGNMLPDTASAQALPFIVRAIDGQDAAAATAEQIQSDFESVSAQISGKYWPYYKTYTELELPQDAIMTLLNTRVTEFTNALVADFPNFNTYPPEACAAIFDMAFNLGLGKLTTGFPTFTKAVRNGDWTTAAAQCHRLPPISADRNNWTQTQFQTAAQS